MQHWLLLITFIVSINGFLRKGPIPSLKCELSKTSLFGIPKLFRWLSESYPVVVEPIFGSLDVDNFYLDMNGIIHSCTHSNSAELVINDEDLMFKKIFTYTDRLYRLVRPKRMMFLAIDGVAPRAKMNQQRARRFRSAKEREVLISDHVEKEGRLPDDESFDSNCITPGTEFMYRLGIAFRKWIKFKQENDPFWKNGAEVIFSGPDVPGEGEHKVMDKIRHEQNHAPDYARGKFKYCLYGLDADLIMLSLVTHEPFFILLREKMKGRTKKSAMQYTPEDFEILEITVLRKMLKDHFRMMNNKMNEATRQSLRKMESSFNEIHRAVIQQVQETDELKKEMKESLSPKGLRKFEDEKIEMKQLIDAKKNEYRTITFELERVVDDFVFMLVYYNHIYNNFCAINPLMSD